MHKYLRPNNLMLLETEKDGPFTLKISMQLESVMRKCDVEVKYKAPEEFQGVGGLSNKTDIWSAGIVLYEMCALKRPYDGADDE